MSVGGPQRKTLFATESVTSTVLRAELEHAGLPVNRARAGT